ncbi:ABC transporter substrate-binding protein [Nocardioides sp.]|uniref:ABC transporter substrate-binding protein n=1 Tax=Nocardioides sp. TaxID=35761 RepID=UPI0035125B30
MRRRIAATAALLLVCGGLAACSDDDEQVGTPRPPSPVPLTGSAEGADGSAGGLGEEEPVRLGVLVSLTSASGEGADYATRGSAAAGGAWVAAFRYGLGGRTVDLVVRDDRGRSSDAVRAVRDFADADVAGIVVASGGAHLADARAATTGAGLPVVLPYGGTPAPTLPEGVWETGPSRDQVAAALATAAADQGVRRPAVLWEGEEPEIPDAAVSLPVGAGERDPDAAVRRLARLAEAGRIDGVIATGGAPTLADVVAAVQGELSSLPVLLGPAATTPAFAEALIGPDGRGTAAGPLSAVGVDATDATTLTAGAAGDAAAAFFAGQRLAASGGVADDVLGDFASFGYGADIASHDAVVALVTAAERAGSADPADVGAALKGATLDAGNGLAGPALDFGDARALPDDAVRMLSPTVQSPGVRPVPVSADGGAAPVLLYWIPQPDSRG